MKKWAFVLLAAALLTGCNEKEQTVSEQHQQHLNEETSYSNPQQTLKSNSGTATLTFPKLLKPTSEQGDDIVYELVAQEGTMTFVDGIDTKTYGYNGNFLGPVLRLREGQHVSIKLTNKLQEPTTFHWHGLEVSGDATDGGPHALIEPGETKTIQFTVNQQAATLWYHPHPMGNTAKQVYNGLAGLLYIEDKQSERRNLPKDYAKNDFPIILQDRSFVDGKLQYEDVANTMGTLGDTMMINGVVNAALSAPNEKVRLRILNGSNALTYHLRFNNDLPFELIATDGGFLNVSSEMTSITLGAGERIEILVDLTKVKGDTLSLLNDETVILPIHISGKATSNDYDSNLNALNETEHLAKLEPTKRITMEGMTKNFLLNGKTYDHDRIDFRQKRGETEIWEIENIISKEGAMAHPFHIHGTQFLVVSVDGKEPDASMKGYKDTITVQPMQKIRIAVNFQEAGLYMFHCHILEHEDEGMMGQIEVFE